MILLALLLVPALIATVGYYRGEGRITLPELGIQLALMGGFMVGGYYLARWGGLQDYEIWNGRVADKDSGSEGCCHSYDCNCREECSGTGAERSCSRVCDTCYEHSYDDWYNATSTNGEEIYYDGCNPPGSPIPYTWSNIRIGEPTAVEHRFTNYIKAAPEDFFPNWNSAPAYALPEYPEVLGWRANRFLFVNIFNSEAENLNNALAELNADLGRPHQVNLIVVVAPEEDPAYFDALQAKWLGGKKNDVVLVIGAPRFPEITWVRVMAWNIASGVEDAFKGEVQRRVEALPRFDGYAILDILRQEVKDKYVRRPFAEFAELSARATPPWWATILLFLLAIGGSALLHRLFRNNLWRDREKPRPPRFVSHFWHSWRASRLLRWWRKP